MASYKAVLRLALEYACCWCCLPTPLTLASGGGESDVHACGPPASFSVYLACNAVTPAGSVHKSWDDHVMRMWVQLKKWCVCVLQRVHSGDGCDLASTLCKYDLRKGDSFVLSWARVWRVMRESISSELLMCGGGVRSTLLLPLVARCWSMLCVCRGCDECCVFCLYCEEWSCMWSCMGSVSVSSCVCLCLVCILWQFSMLRSAWLAVCYCWSRMQEATIQKRHTPEPVS